MGSMRAEENLEARADLFKALGHPTRLLILNLMRIKPRHGEELATILNLKPATISHHLAKLSAVGLLASRKDQYYQTYSLVPAVLEKSLGEVVHLPQPGLTAEVEEDAYRDKVLRTFIKRGRLTQFPAQYKKRLIILDKLVEEFELGRVYSEQEVNQILVEFHEDVATLRREMIDHRLMAREGGRYRRLVTEGGEGGDDRRADR
jgi:ArsR family transcriptional regulator, arsenate/arsenite/antimonite-responsive transcriptional repressor